MSSTAVNPLTAGRLPRWFAPIVVLGSVVLAFAVLALTESMSLVGFFGLAATLYLGVTHIASSLVEGKRRALNRLMAGLATLAFLLAILPLFSLLWTTVTAGLRRFDLMFFTHSMRNVVGQDGGAIHAIYGTLWVTGIAALISIPIGLLAAIYLVEYGRGRLRRAITFFVDVMTGIPSIVAGLFAYAVLAAIFGLGTINGFSGSLALSVLMIPVVVRSSEEMLRIVPNELREASYALGVPKWRTVLKVVLPTAFSGIVSGIMLSIARVIGETAPLMVAAGFTQSVNVNPLREQMMTLPVFVYDSYSYPGADVSAYLDRAWAGALTLVLIVMLLNLIGRLVARSRMNG